MFKNLKEEFINLQKYEVGANLRGIEKYIMNIIEEEKNGKSPSSIKFQPWVGDNYKNENPKILVLGESHYGNADANKEIFTQNVIKSLALRIQGRHRFFTMVAKTLLDKTNYLLNDDDSKELWNKVSFYNYIQDFVGDKSRTRPQEYMWKEARKPFQEVLEMLNPDIIIVTGKELGNYIKRDIENFENKIFCFWSHPSGFGRFDYQKSLEDFKIALEKLSNRKS